VNQKTFFRTSVVKHDYEFLPQSSIVFNLEMFGPNISLSGLHHLQNICDYATEHNITFNCNKTFDFFCLKKYKQPASFEYFPQWCMCTIFGPSQISFVDYSMPN